MNFKFVVCIDFPEVVYPGNCEVETIISSDYGFHVMDIYSLFTPLFQKFPMDKIRIITAYLSEMLNLPVIKIEEFDQDLAMSFSNIFKPDCNSFHLIPYSEHQFGLFQNGELIMLLSPFMSYKMTISKNDDRFFITRENGKIDEIGHFGLVPLPERIAYCGRFVPALNHGFEVISEVHFTSIILNSSYIELVGSQKNVKIKLPIGTDVSLNLISPVAYSVKNLLLNELLVDSTSTCFMNLFHLQVDSLTFISSISCPWKNSYVAISDALVSSKLPAHNIKIGILDENGNVFTFHKADSLFSTDKSYEQGWRIMQIVIVSDSNMKVTFGKEEFSTANLSIFPKFIAHLAAFELRRQSEVDPDVSTSRYLRRLISVAIDNGVAVDLIDFCKLKIDKDTELSHQHFDSVVLRLQEHVDKFEDEAIKDELELPLFNCRHFLSETSNESSICSLFWNLVINTLFKSEASLYDKQNYRIELEWSTRNLYPTANHRKVDLVCVIDLERSCGESVPIPMLCVESGMYPFTWESQHKDLSKILGMMSANCVTLAHELIKAGKRPELAKVYGMLIGGTKVQFCVAEAVITQKIDDEKVFEVHANISFNKKWFFDIFDSLPPSSRSNLSPPIPHIKRLFEISPFLGLDIPEIHFKPEVKEAATLEEVGANSEFYGEVLNYFGLKNVKAFIEIIKSQIHLIFASPVDDAKDEIKRTFESPSRDFYFSKSLDQSRDTPKTGRVSESNNWEGDPPASPIPSRLGQESFPTTFNQSKTSKFEFELYKKCAILFSSFFPRIYDMREESTQSTEEEKKSFFYKFELMSPLVSPELGCSKILLGSDDSLENLVQVIKLSIDCLYGLFLLHSVLNVLHCDISPVNIMYSEIDSIWKIIDFDSSVEGVDQGGRLQIIRNQIVGTRGFIAPESLERGEYTELSDIFALGTVIFDLLYPKLYHQFGEDGEHCKYLYSFEAILLGMNDPNYKNRSSLKSCLSKLFSLLKKILPDDSLILKDQVSCAVQILESNQFTLGIDPIKHGVDRKMRPPSIPFKYLPSTRTVEEKEPSGMTVENTVSTSNKFII